MTTARAMQHLQTLIELDKRAEAQMSALANTLRQVITQMDAILDDTDLPVNETLTEKTTGLETQFTLRQSPVKAGTIVLKLDGVTVAKAGYAVAKNIITPIAAIPAGKALQAEYVVLGLKTQTAHLMTEIDDLSAADFIAKKARYERTIQWLDNERT